MKNSALFYVKSKRQHSQIILEKKTPENNFLPCSDRLRTAFYFIKKTISYSVLFFFGLNSCNNNLLLFFYPFDFGTEIFGNKTDGCISTVVFYKRR